MKIEWPHQKYGFLGYEERSQTNFLVDAINYGLTPWRPDVVYIYDEFDIDYNKFTIELVAKWESGYYVSYKFPFERDEAIFGDNWVWKVYPRIVEAFRNRPVTLVPPNIILGED